MADRNSASLQGLIGDALRDTGELAQKEFALFRAEMAANIGFMAKGAGFFVGAAVFAVASLIWLTQALVEWLAFLIGSRTIAALIVGVLLLVIAGVLGLVGKRAFSAASLAPTRTVRSLKRDSQIITERVSA